MAESEDGELLDVRKFHQKLGHLHGAGCAPRHLTKRKLAERANFLLEELTEFATVAGLELHARMDDDGRGGGLYFLPTEGADQDLALQADALVDLVYVAKGTADMLALPWRELWADVQRANLAKEPGVTHRGNAVDAVKPPGWQGPRTTEILEAHGYRPDLFLDVDERVHDSLCVDDTPGREN